MKRTPFNNKKSQIFIVFVAGAVIVGLISAYFLLSYLYADKTRDEHLGVYESSMVDAMIAGEQSLITVDTAVPYALDDALSHFAANGGIPIANEYEGESTDMDCGRYVYKLWNSETKNCYPTINDFSIYIDTALNHRLSASESTAVHNSIMHDYKYQPTYAKTTIKAIAQDTYVFELFKNGVYASDKAVQKYVAAQKQLSEGFIWPVPGHYYISSCFGYRGFVMQGASKTHAGIDIPANIGTPVVAAADGTIELMSTSGTMIISHTSGLKSAYLHLDSFAKGLHVKDAVKQGDIIAYVGNRGISESSHLHFEIIDDQIDDSLAYEGANAVLDQTLGKKINPMCLFDEKSLKQITLNKDSLSCSANKIYDDSGTPINTKTPELGGAYKFCSVYGLVQGAATGDSTTNTPSNSSTAQSKSQSISQSVNQAIDQTTDASVKLTSDQQAKLDATKANLQKSGLMQSIVDTTQKEGIPPEIFLGLITVESTGDFHAKNGGAIGLTQITKPTFDDTNFDNKCTWEELANDPQCQIRGGAAILKSKYEQFKKGKLYACSCVGDACAVKQFYTEWNAALRGYNGWGCTKDDQVYYVENVMLYANAFGYTLNTAYVTTARDEIDKGIIGTYSLKPSFTAQLGFDMSIIDTLSAFMKTTTEECRGPDQAKQACVDAHIKKFNDQIAIKYKNNGASIELTIDCEQSPEEKTVNAVAQALEDCKSSPDKNCICDMSTVKTTLPASGNVMMKATSDEGSSQLMYKPLGKSINVLNEQYTVDVGYPIIRGTPVKNVDISAKDVAVFKANDYFSIVSPTDNVNPANMCNVVRNKFKMCLKTQYTTRTFTENGITTSPVTLKFSILIRDNDPPKPVEGLQLVNMPHANSVMISWDKNSEADVVSYNIYSSNSESAFSGDIASIKTQTDRISLNIIDKPYISYKDITLAPLDDDYPACHLMYDQLNRPYCIFEYNAIDANGNTIKLTLEHNTLYYIASTNRFLYIVDYGEGQKYVAVTAADSDGKEINNVDSNQRIEMGKNLQVIDVHRTLEPGLAYNVQANVLRNEYSVAQQLRVSWSWADLYINGEEIRERAKYSVYLIPSHQCDELSSVPVPYASVAETLDNSATVNLLGYTPGSYCLIVATSSDGKQFLKGLGTKIVI
jgi:murein DD-endopeptidase MepM/ murein hydrolase activator NlpD